MPENMESFFDKQRKEISNKSNTSFKYARENSIEDYTEKPVLNKNIQAAKRQNTDRLLNFRPDSLLQGILFSEILGKPRSIKKGR